MTSPMDIGATNVQFKEIQTTSIEPCDGALFNAVSFGYYGDQHFYATLRSILSRAMKERSYISEDIDLIYSTDIWNTPIRVPALELLSELLIVRIILYEYDSDKRSITTHSYGSGPHIIKILRKGVNRYEVLTFTFNNSDPIINGCR